MARTGSRQFGSQLVVDRMEDRLAPAKWGLDRTFGSGDGVTTVENGTLGREFRAVAVQPDGRLVAGLMAGVNVVADAPFSVLRFTADGAPDPTFDGDGAKPIRLTEDAPEAFGDGKVAVAVQPDGRIVVAAGILILRNGGERVVAVVRLNPDGSFDPTFGVGGKVQFAFPGNLGGGTGAYEQRVRAIALQPDGRVVVLADAIYFQDGVLNQDPGLVRLNPDGSPDAGFGGGGRVIVPVCQPLRQEQFSGYNVSYGFPRAEGRDIDLLADGRIVVTAHTLVWSTRSGGTDRRDVGFVTVARLSADGRPDPTFDGDGVKSFEYAGRPDGDTGGAVASDDGRVTVVGIHYAWADVYGPSRRVTVTRLNPDGSYDASVNGTGTTLTPGLPIITARDVHPGPDGSAYLIGHTNSFDPAVVRVRADGTPDPAFDGDGIYAGEDFRTAYAPGNSTTSGRYPTGGAVAADGRVYLAGSFHSGAFTHERAAFVARVEPKPTRGTVQFAAATVVVNESAATAELTVTRTDGSEGAVAVTYATLTGSAGLTDYAETTGTLSWADGQDGPKSFRVPITADAVAEPTESFRVALAADGSTELGTPAVVTVTITETPVPVPPPPVLPPPPPPGPPPPPDPTPDPDPRLTGGLATGAVVIDTDGDRTLDPDEPGVPGVTVYFDVNGNGAFDAGEPFNRTRGDGVFALAAELDGFYLIRFVIPDGFERATLGDGVWVGLAAGQLVPGVVFGVRPAPPGSPPVSPVPPGSPPPISPPPVSPPVNPPPIAVPRALVGFPQSAVGGAGTVLLSNPNGSARFTATPFPSFSGGVRTAAADFNGDGVADLVAGTGPGRATRVVVLDSATQRELFSVDPFEASFTGGVYVAAGDLNDDGKADLVITPDEGGGPRVDIYSGTGFGKLASFFGIDDPNFRGGARAATGDISGDGRADLIVVAGFGGGPRVAGFDGKSVGGTPVKIFADFFAFEQTLRNGVFVAAGDLDGDGNAELIAGGGPGGGPRVTAFGGKPLLANQLDVRANFFGGDPANRGGVRVAVKDLDGDSRADLVVGGTSRATAYLGKNVTPAGTPPTAFDLDPGAVSAAGVFVG